MPERIGCLRFVCRAEEGIDPPPATRCLGCGEPRAEHGPSCPGVLNLAGEHFPCDLMAPHDGWGHANTKAHAVWQ